MKTDKDTRPTLSVIVPIFNVKSTLDRCLESILDDSLEMEVWLVDDGSTDESARIAREWTVKDVRFHLISQPHSGLSAARNAGLRKAQGKYVTFVDSDDYLEPGSLSAACQALEQTQEADIMEYGVRVHEGGPDERLLTFPDHLWSSARTYWEESEAWNHAYAWNKVFRLSSLEGITFPEGRLFEDLWFLSELLSRNPRVATLSLGLYSYVWNPLGLAAKAGGTGLQQLLESQMRAAHLMGTSPLTRKGRLLYRQMLCTQIDVYRLTGRVLLKWPLVRLVCFLHTKFFHPK